MTILISSIKEKQAYLVNSENEPAITELNPSLSRSFGNPFTVAIIYSTIIAAMKNGMAYV